MSLSLNEEQRAALQPEVQRELEKREWAEAGDNVMAEYVTVLLANGNSRERVHTEMDDLVGPDFHPEFLDWLFDSAQRLIAPPRERDISPVREREHRDRSPVRSRRLLDSALGGLGNNKRKSDADGGSNKRRISEGSPSAPAAAPGGPRAMMGEGRGLADRMGPRRGGMAVRGRGRGGMGGGGGLGFRGNGMPNQNMNMNMNMNQSQGFGSFFNPGQQEMMAQMMMMQANMAQMGEMMQHMVEEKEQTAPPPPTRSAPVKVPHGTKLGGHSVSAITPKPSSAPGPIPEKPSSKALCRYSIGCSNARCPYSHPSPVADEQSGMVLSEEPCEEGKKCKDAECTKSHVSPAAVLGDTAGPSRLLCKYLNCTNPACAFRHEDAQGNPIPPPALTAAKTAKEAPAPKSPAVPTGSSVNAGSDNEDGDFEVVMSSRGLMDGPLDDKMGAEKQCRYGERCTRSDCKFNHPASRPTPKAKFGAGKAPYKAPSFGNMNKSKKFGSAPSNTGGEKKTLNPSAGSFVPKEVPS